MRSVLLFYFLAFSVFGFAQSDFDFWLPASQQQANQSSGVNVYAYQNALTPAPDFNSSAGWTDPSVSNIDFFVSSVSGTFFSYDGTYRLVIDNTGNNVTSDVEFIGELSTTLEVGATYEVRVWVNRARGLDNYRVALDASQGWVATNEVTVFPNINQYQEVVLTGETDSATASITVAITNGGQANDLFFIDRLTIIKQ